MSMSERDALLPKEDHVPVTGFFSPIRRVLFVALVSAASFAFTQTSLIYAFRVMTCDDYYDHAPLSHPYPHVNEAGSGIGHGDGAGIMGGGKDRCSIPVIEGRTARAIAIMSTMTTFCSILNLFVTSHWFKKFGIKTSMTQQTFWASLRSLTQIYALSIGGSFGITMITITQVINILGSGGGYELASMAYIAELCVGEERTGMFGVLLGVRMLGAALGYIFGGIAFDYGGMLLPFQIAFVLLVFTTIFAALFLPYIDPTPQPTQSSSTTQTDPKKKKQSFLTPLKIFIPKRILVEGKGRWDFNLFFLASGAFFSVLATGYVGMGLQLVATNVFGFKPGDSGLMLSLNLSMRAFFLSILFPRIISSGRKWLSPSHSPLPPQHPIEEPEPIEGHPTNLLPPTSEPTQEPTDTQHGSAFDLLFLQFSIFLDGLLTALVTFASSGTHIYIAAGVLPFASGTGSAVKGVVMDLVGGEEKADALSGIALVEKLAQVSTISLFGFIFSLLSEKGYPTAVFLANGGIAMVGFILLLFVRMPRRSIVLE